MVSSNLRMSDKWYPTLVASDPDLATNLPWGCIQPPVRLTVHAIITCAEINPMKGNIGDSRELLNSSQYCGVEEQEMILTYCGQWSNAWACITNINETLKFLMALSHHTPHSLVSNSSITNAMLHIYICIGSKPMVLNNRKSWLTYRPKHCKESLALARSIRQSLFKVLKWHCSLNTYMFNQAKSLSGWDASASAYETHT